MCVADRRAGGPGRDSEGDPGGDVYEKS